MFSSAILLPPAIATEVDCQGGHKCQTCAGTEECKALEMSGRCRGPITCGNPNEPCACVVNIRAKTDSLDQKKPLGKSQR